MSDHTSRHRASFLRAFLVSAVGTGLSRILGAARDITIAGFLGAGAGSDAFWIAFTVPSVFRRFLADEGLTGVMVPTVAQTEKEQGTAHARRLTNVLFSGLLLVNLVACTLGMLFPEPLVKAFAYSFVADPEKYALTVELTRWLVPFASFVSLLSFAEGLLNHRGHFFVPKIAPGVVSACIVASALWLGSLVSQPEYALVIGVLAGGFLHVLIAVPPLVKRWGWLKLDLHFGMPRARRAAREMGKVVLIGVLAQTQILVLRQLAASLGDGAVTRYWYANRLVDLAQGMVAVGIGSALLPTVSQAIAAKDWSRFRSDYNYALRLAAFILVPTAAVLACFATPITAVLFRHGRFTWTDVQWTVHTLQALAPFLLFASGINITRKAYYALDDRNAIVGIGVLGVGLTALLGWSLTQRFDIVGLGLALSISFGIQYTAYLALLGRKVHGGMRLASLVGPISRMLAASAPLAAFLWWLQGFGQWEQGPTRVTNLVILFGGLCAGGLVYLASAWVLRVQELRSLEAMLRRRLARH